jgi:hypothetical protein
MRRRRETIQKPDTIRPTAAHLTEAPKTLAGQSDERQRIDAAALHLSSQLVFS